MESLIASYITNMQNFNNKLCKQINCIHNIILNISSTNENIFLTNENILLQYLDIVKNTYNILHNYEVNYRELSFDNINDNIIYLKENLNNNIIKLYTINTNFEKIINSLLNKHCNNNNKRYIEEIDDNNNNNNNKKIKVNSLLNNNCNNKRYLEEIDDNNNKKIKVN
jgi:hypothetical protein